MNRAKFFLSGLFVAGFILMGAFSRMQVKAMGYEFQDLNGQAQQLRAEVAWLSAQKSDLVQNYEVHVVERSQMLVRIQPAVETVGPRVAQNRR